MTRVPYRAVEPPAFVLLSPGRAARPFLEPRDPSWPPVPSLCSRERSGVFASRKARGLQARGLHGAATCWVEGGLLRGPSTEALRAVPRGTALPALIRIDEPRRLPAASLHPASQGNLTGSLT